MRIGNGYSHKSNKPENTLMLSQQDMEDFMEIEAALVEEGEDPAKPEKQSNAIQGSTIARDEVRTVPDLQRTHHDYLQEGMRNLLSAGDQVSDLWAQIAKRS
jgi:hypothetical protein